MSQSDITRNALMNGLKECMKVEPFDKVTVDKICDQTGVCRRTFYRHYLDKYELLNCVFEKDFIEPYLSIKKNSLWDYFPIVCEILYKDRKFYSKALKVEGQNSFRKFVATMVKDNIRQDIGEYFLTEQELECGVRVLLNMYYEAYVLWLDAEEPMEPEAFSKSVLERSSKIFRCMSQEINETLTMTHS